MEQTRTIIDLTQIGEGAKQAVKLAKNEVIGHIKGELSGEVRNLSLAPEGSYLHLLEQVSQQEYLEHGEYSGRLGNVLSDLLSDKPLHPAQLIHHGARIINASVAYKNTHPEEFMAEARVYDEALTLALGLAGSVEDRQASVNRFLEHIEALDKSGELQDMHDFLNQPIVQKQKPEAAWSITAENIMRVGDEIIEKAGDEPVFLTTFVNGATPGYISLVDHIRRNLPDKNHLFYPIKYSTQSSNDVRPKLAANEIPYLKREINRRNIRIAYAFDEIALGGHTLVQGTRYLSREINRIGADQELNIYPPIHLEALCALNAQRKVLEKMGDHFVALVGKSLS